MQGRLLPQEPEEGAERRRAARHTCTDSDATGEVEEDYPVRFPRLRGAGAPDPILDCLPGAYASEAPPQCDCANGTVP